MVKWSHYSECHSCGKEGAIAMMFRPYLGFALCIFLASCGQESTDQAAAPTEGASQVAQVQGQQPPAEESAITAAADAFIQEVKGWEDSASGEQSQDGVTVRIRFSFPGEYELGAPQINGNEATVPVAVRDDSMVMSVPLRLRKTGATWDVYAMGSGAMSMYFTRDDQGRVTFDVERMQTIAAERMAAEQEEKTALKRTATFPIFGYANREALEATWTIDLTVEGDAFGQVLEPILDDLGLELGNRRTLSELLSSPVTLQAKNVSRLEALDMLGAKVGHYATFTDSFMPGRPHKVSFHEGQRSLPITFSGPFLVEFQNFYGPSPQGTGSMVLELWGLGLEQAALVAGEEELVTITAVTGADGANLMRAGEEVEVKLEGGHARRDLIGEIKIPLQNIDEDVLTIESVKGTIRAPLVVKTAVLRFDNLEKGASQKAGAMEFIWLGGGSFKVVGATKHFGRRHITITGYDESGNTIASNSSGYMRAGGETSVDKSFVKTPARIDLTVVQDVAYVDFEFELTNIPLSR